MRLLITTQAVDLDDPVLAFFHGWLVKFSEEVESVEVICLKEGRHALPANVHVHSLGKETAPSRIQYVLLLFKYVWTLRKKYDAVFVHMNPEYLVLCGWFWKSWGKTIALWYIHPQSSWRLRRGMKYADYILSASAGSFPIKTPKLRAMGIGVDTDFFSPLESSPSSALRIMCAARIAPVKHVECMIDATRIVSKLQPHLTFDYYGEELPRDAEYADAMRKRAEPVAAWTFRGKADSIQIRDAYRTHDIHVNATTSGSFDKAVFEAMACGCISVASNVALSEVLPRELLFHEGDPEALSRTIAGVASLPSEERDMLRVQMRQLALNRYSLTALIRRIVDVLA